MNVLVAQLHPPHMTSCHGLGTINPTERPHLIGGPLKIASLVISDESDGVYLFYRDETGTCVADTWHVSIEAAKECARAEFNVEESHWKVAADTDVTK